VPLSTNGRMDGVSRLVNEPPLALAPFMGVPVQEPVLGVGGEEDASAAGQREMPGHPSSATSKVMPFGSLNFSST
jgi:hypothetical protein